MLSDVLKQVMIELPSGSWCSPLKARHMVETILAEKPKTLVEIGVFGGCSLSVIARAAQAVKGNVYGIDPWSKDAAIESTPQGTNLTWWGSLDYEAVYRGCVLRLKTLGLDKTATLIRSKSDDTATLKQFADGSIDLMHFDGNHNVEPCLRDVKLWLPKLAKKATVYFDDIGWTDGGVVDTTAKATAHLADHGWTIEEMIGTCGVIRCKG